MTNVIPDNLNPPNSLGIEGDAWDDLYVDHIHSKHILLTRYVTPLSGVLHAELSVLGDDLADCLHLRDSGLYIGQARMATGSEVDDLAAKLNSFFGTPAQIDLGVRAHGYTHIDAGYDSLVQIISRIQSLSSLSLDILAVDNRVTALQAQVDSLGGGGGGSGGSSTLFDLTDTNITSQAIEAGSQLRWELDTGASSGTGAGKWVDYTSPIPGELADTQTGAGLESDGSYLPITAANYIQAASSLKDADHKLDTQVKGNADNISTNAAAIAANTASISALPTVTPSLTHNVIYVDPNQTYVAPDEGDGSMELPYTTIEDALDAADTAVNTTIFLQAGTHTYYKASGFHEKSWTGSLSFVGVSKSETIVTAGTLDYDCMPMRYKAGGLHFKSLTIATAKYGIYARDCANVTIDNVRFLNCGSSGDSTTHDGSKTQVDQAATWAGSDTSNGGATRIRSCTDVRIIDSSIDYCLRGFRVQDCDNGLISGNKVYRTLESGIYLAAGSYSGASGCNNIQIHSNVVEGAANNGILVIGGKGNSVFGNEIISSWNSAIQIWHGLEVTVESNSMLDCNNKTWNGIGVLGDAWGQIVCMGANAIGSGEFLMHSSHNTAMLCKQGRASSVYNVVVDATDDSMTYPTANGENEYTSTINLSDAPVEAVNAGSSNNLSQKSVVGGPTSGNVLLNWEETSGGHILPDTNSAYDLGSAEYKVRHLFLSDASLWVGDDHKVETAHEGKMKFRKRKKDKVPTPIVNLAATQDPALTETEAKTAAMALAVKSSVSELTLTDWLTYYRSLTGHDATLTPDAFYDLNAPDDWETIYEAADAGVDGATGPQGPQGEQGLQGEQGIQGIQGIQGEVGPQGAIGPAGPTGATGATGPTGPQGPQGATGPQGDQGSQGPQGDAGPQGVQGIQGPTGSGITFKGEVDTDPPPTGDVTPIGGTTFTPAQGDAVLTQTTDKLYIYNGTAWVDGGSIQGPQGIQGVAGPQGAQGPQGDQGVQGPQGDTGTQGPAGADGADGAVGPQGPQGSQGIQGLQGPQGDTGPQGPAGADGADGADAPGPPYFTVDYATFGSVDADHDDNFAINEPDLVLPAEQFYSDHDVWYYRNFPSEGVVRIGTGIAIQPGETVLFGGDILNDAGTKYPRHRGIYQLITDVSGGTPFEAKFTRIAGLNESSEFIDGTRVYVKKGIWAGYDCVISVPDSFTLGTDDITVTTKKADGSRGNIILVDDAATSIGTGGVLEHWRDGVADTIHIPDTWVGASLTIQLPTSSHDHALGDKIRVTRGSDSGGSVKVTLGSNQDRAIVFGGLSTAGTFLEEIYVPKNTSLEMLLVLNEQNTKSYSFYEVWYCTFAVNQPLPLNLSKDSTSPGNVFNLDISDGSIMRWDGTGATFKDVSVDGAGWTLDTAITGSTSISAPTNPDVYEEIYVVNTASDSSVVLPEPSPGGAVSIPPGFKYSFKNVGTKTVTLSAANSVTIDSNSEYKLFPQDSVTLLCDGSSYLITDGAPGATGATGAAGTSITFKGEVSTDSVFSTTPPLALVGGGTFTPQAGNAVIAQFGTENNVIYVYDGTSPYNQSGWVSGGSLEGPAGPTGPTGPAGTASRPGVVPTGNTSPFTIGSTDTAIASTEVERIYVCNDVGVGEVVLPSASGLSGFKLQIKNTHSSSVKISPTGSEYIDVSTQTNFTINQYSNLTLVSDGANWLII